MKSTKIDTEKLTFKELRGMVGETEGRLPSVNRLMERVSNHEDEVLLEKQSGGTAITVFKSGYIIYSRGEFSTVYAVDRCKARKTDAVELTAEMSGEYRSMGYEVHDGCIYIPEKFYEDAIWIFPISMICEERLDHNQESREEYVSDFSMDGEGGAWNKQLITPGFVEKAEMEAAEEEWERVQKKKRQEQHERLTAALSKLTDKQRRAVDLYYSRDGMTEKKVADELGVSQQAVHKSLAAAKKKIEKFF